MTDTFDPLSETPEPARIIPFKPVKVFEEPTERAMMGLTCAVEELDYVVCLARSADALAELRASAEDAIKRLIAISSVCLTLEQLEREKQS